MPDGADAVVMVEKTTLDEAAGTVLIDLSVSEGNHVRRAGEDVEPGDLLFAAGTVLTAGHLGVLASVGVQEVECVRRPKVGVISTGDELVDDGRPCNPERSAIPTVAPSSPSSLRPVGRRSISASRSISPTRSRRLRCGCGRV